MKRGKQETRERTEILRLVEVAREHGHRDVFHGKRRWSRYHMGMRLEVAPERDETAARPATLHNISAGGFGFRFERELPMGDRLLVREWTPEHTAVWLPARVMHSSLGLSGHLVGAEFDLPTTHGQVDADRESAASAGPDVLSDAEHPGTNDAGRPAQTPRRSLRTEFACTSAAAAPFGVALAFMVCTFVWPNTWSSWLPLVSAVFAFAIGGLAAWAVSGREARFADKLRELIECLVRGNWDARTLPEAPSKELNGLREACLALRDEWGKYEYGRLAQQRRLEGLDRTSHTILDVVSQDLYGPLKSIQQQSQSLADQLKVLGREDQQQRVRAIANESGRLSRLIDDLLSAQRFETGRARWQLQPQDLALTVADNVGAYEPLAQDRDIAFQVQCDEALPPVLVDTDKMSQVIGNLLAHAFRQTPDGGSVRLAVRTTDEELQVRVSDSGPGIARERWDRVFDCFDRDPAAAIDGRDRPGLGLYLVRRIVEGHGGRVWIDSAPSQGSEFVVALPVTNIDLSAEAIANDRPPRERAVVCDADPELASRLAQVLRRENFSVRLAHSGKRLLEQIEESAPDLVVTDILLSDIDARSLLEALSDTPGRAYRLIVHTCIDEQPQIESGGVDAFVQRPAKTNDLLEAVKVVMSPRPAAADDSAVG